MSGPRINPTVVSEQLQIEAPLQQLVLPTQFIKNLDIGSDSPSVENVERLVAANTVPVTVTNFKSGQEGQQVIILGDGFTTVNATGNIRPVGGSHLLNNGALYIFVLFNSLWREF